MTAPVLERTDPVTTGTESDLPDFEPQCSISTTDLVREMAKLQPTPCEEPAKWSGVTPCCGAVALVCDHHRHNHGPFKCHCNRLSLDLIGWTRL